MIRLEGESGPGHLPAERLSAWLDDQVRGEARAETQAHLRACHTCAAEIRLWERIRRALRLLTELPVPPGLLPRLLSALQNA